MGRHELREQVFKLLFRVEFNRPEDMPEQVELFFEGEEGLCCERDVEYIRDKYLKLQEKLPDLDKRINDNTKGWDTRRIGRVELTILRLAVYEILFDEDIPPGVAINEAVEIAKKYGQDNAGGFVNAILGKIAKQGDQDS